MPTSFLWALVTLILLRLTERWIHRHLQLLGYRLTGSQTVALVIYAIVLFPGVLAHELSHWVFAKLSGVRTGRVSLLPSMNKNGDLQLGSVEYSSAGLDPIRESLIGAAPLITGCAILLLIANHLFGIPEVKSALTSGAPEAMISLLANSLSAPDFWLWFYLAFAVANAMMPSPADRKAWPAFLVIIALIIGLSLLLGLGDLILLGVEGPLALGASYLATAFTFTIGINVLIMGVLLLLEGLLGGMSNR